MHIEPKSIPHQSRNKHLAKHIIGLFSGRVEYARLGFLHEALQNISDSDLADYVRFISEQAIRQGYVLSRSGANQGLFGCVNRLGRLRKDLRNLFRSNTHRILAEGDSWFEYIFSCDTIGHLQSILPCKIKTIAAGGDWLGTYFLSDELERKLQSFRPHLVLLSGGGNDLLQDGNISNLIRTDRRFDLKDPPENLQQEILLGKKFLNHRFFSTISILGFLYVCIVERINRQVPRPIQIIVHGYDYPYPNDARKRLAQKILKNGQWLKRPLCDMGIENPILQRAIAKAMIAEFNRMLSHLAHAPSLYNFLYIDSRGIAPEPSDWQDELHPSSDAFLRLAKAFKSALTEKTIKTGVQKPF